MMKYSDDTINQMARKALYLEKAKQYEEALNIYMELASYGNEFSRERIPLIKHKIEQSKLKNVNFFLKFIALGAAILTALVISTSILDNILIKPISIKNVQQYTSESNFTQGNIKFKFNEIKEIPKSIINSELEILIDSKTSTKKLKDRAIEALNLYKSELYLSKGKINIIMKTFNDREVVGFIEYDSTNEDYCMIHLLKK